MKHFTYFQLNTDANYWPEKMVAGVQTRGGHTAGLFMCVEEGRPIHSLLIDAGLGTIQALSELGFPWGSSLDCLNTHGHADHHLELMILSEIHCLRFGPPGARPINVYCTQETFEQTLNRVHGFRFCQGASQTLKFCPVIPATSANPLPDPFPIGPAGIFQGRAIESDHFAGAVNYAVEFSAESGMQKVDILWDLKTPPDPEVFTFLRNPTLALVEANTVRKSAKSGHVSGEDLLESNFLNRLDCRVAGSGPPYGIFLVHFGGRVDESSRSIIADSDFLATIATEISPMPSTVIGLAKRLQRWDF